MDPWANPIHISETAFWLLHCLDDLSKIRVIYKGSSWAWELAKSVKCLPGKQEDPGLIPRMDVKIPGIEACACNAGSGEAKIGSLRLYWLTSFA